MYLISQGLIPRNSAAQQTNDERSESRADTPLLCCEEFHYNGFWYFANGDDCYFMSAVRFNSVMPIVKR